MASSEEPAFAVATRITRIGTRGGYEKAPRKKHTTLVFYSTPSSALHVPSKPWSRNAMWAPTPFGALFSLMSGQQEPSIAPNGLANQVQRAATAGTGVMLDIEPHVLP